MSEGFGGVAYQNVTNIHPLGLAMVIILGIVMLIVPRRWSIIPMLIIACFVSAVQKISIFSLDFNLLRIMVMFGVVRLAIRHEYRGFVWKSIDKVILYYTASATIILTIQSGSFNTFIFCLGFSFDVLGMYFLFRCLIQKWEDIDRLIIGCIVISIPVALFFLIENRTGRNIFSIFGGVPEITPARYGRLRCQGAFSHAILAGCFWAALMPLMAAYWWRSAKDRIWAVTGIITSGIIVFCCASSTPVMGVLAALIGGLMFYCRNYMQVIRWGIVLMLIALHIVMKAPVWHLISRISAVGGSTGYHRYMLINAAINHFNEWALMGTKSTAHWGFGAQDVCIQYVLEGVHGGLLTLVLFVAIIVLTFQGIGRLWRRYSQDSYRLILSWAIGVSLFVHCVNFIGVSYFGQINIIWYLLLAMISSMSPVSSGVARALPYYSGLGGKNGDTTKPRL